MIKIYKKLYIIYVVKPMKHGTKLQSGTEHIYICINVSYKFSIYMENTNEILSLLFLVRKKIKINKFIYFNLVFFK